MLPGVLQMTIEEDATYDPPTLTLRYKDTLLPYDLSVYASLYLDIKNNWWDTSTVFSMTTTNGRLTSGGAAGTIARYIAKADVATLIDALTQKKGVYVLRGVKETGEEDPILRGTLLINQWAPTS